MVNLILPLKAKSKLSFPFLPKQKVLAPITPGSDCAALRAGAASSFLVFSDLFKTLYLSDFMSFKVSDAFVARGFEHRQLKGELQTRTGADGRCLLPHAFGCLSGYLVP